jgi:hypothetical protein
MNKKQKNLIITLTAIALIAFAFFQYGMPYLQSQQMAPYLTAQVLCIDGSYFYLDSKTNTEQSIISQTSPNSGKTISQINTNLYLTPTFTGTIQDYGVAGTLSIRVVDLTNNAIVFSTSMALSPLHPTLVSGSPALVASSTMTAANLQGLYAHYVSGRSYKLMDISSNIYMTITFTDGTTITQSAPSTQINWYFKYQS